MISRYSIPEVDLIFEEKFKYWLQIEVLILEYLTEQGVIPLAELQQFKKEACCKCGDIYKEELTVRHDFVAFLNVVSSSTKACSRWLHYGLTSSDVVDTGNSIILQKMNVLIIASIKELLNELKKIAYAYKQLPTIGRTHGAHAEITSFGYKFAIFFDDLTQSLNNFLFCKKDVEHCIISGSVGTFAHTSPQMQDYVAKWLGLFSSKCSTQILSRERYGRYLYALNSLGKTINKIALELRHLSRDEVSEIHEKFEDQQIGSSSMPHKKNPISLENICGMSRMLEGYSTIANLNIDLWHERDISHSSNERIIFQDAGTVLIHIARKMTTTLSKMSINKQNIKRNLELKQENIYSQSVMLKLLLKTNISRQKLRSQIQQLVDKGDFKKFFYESEWSKHFNNQELQEMFDHQYHLRHMDCIYRRIFDSVRCENNFSEIVAQKYEIEESIEKMAHALNEFYAQDENVIVISVLEGSAVFVGHLLPKLSFPLELRSVKLSSYGQQTTSNELLGDIQMKDLKGKKILILEDLLDSGKTLNWLIQKIQSLGAQDVKVAVLLIKERDAYNGKTHNQIVNWYGISVPDQWIAGFGIDSRFKYRNLNFIGVLKTEYQ